MTLSPQAFVDHIIPHKIPKQIGQASAPVNIALSKYWGKRQLALNLPTNSSVSISLPGLGTQTKLEWVAGTTPYQQDEISLNQATLSGEHPFAKRLSLFLNYFRPETPHKTSHHLGHFKVDTLNTVPTAAGLASSASGYAALVMALNDLFQWSLNKQDLSLLARLGSGSASRSVYDGFAVWHKGQSDNGLDSYAEPMPNVWPAFCVGLVEIDIQEKPIGSTSGMQRTVETCEIYQAWPQKAEKDVQTMQTAIQNQDFTLLGETAENNALSMHATMIATWPPILYWQPESVAAMHQVWALRQLGIEVYFTMDAGPNLKLLFLKDQQPKIEAVFPNLKVIEPFKPSRSLTPSPSHSPL